MAVALDGGGALDLCLSAQSDETRNGLLYQHCLCYDPIRVAIADGLSASISDRARSIPRSSAAHGSIARYARARHARAAARAAVRVLAPVTNSRNRSKQRRLARQARTESRCTVNKYLVDVSDISRRCPAGVAHRWRAPASGLEIAERTLYRVARVGALRPVRARPFGDQARRAAGRGGGAHARSGTSTTMLGALMTRRQTRAARARSANSHRLRGAARRRGRRLLVVDVRSSTARSTFRRSSLPADAIFHGYVHVARAERQRGIATCAVQRGRDVFPRPRRARSAGSSSRPRMPRALAPRARERWGGRSRHIARSRATPRSPSARRRTLKLSEPE